jgi:dCMP deaminase
MDDNKWFHRWMRIAKEAASWSKDPSTKVGAVIYDEQNTPHSMGYNGFARGVDDTDERLLNKEQKYKLVVHAEANAILNATRTGARLAGCTMVVTHPPCPACASMIIQAGITRVVTAIPEKDFSHWNPELSAKIFKEAGVQFLALP